MVYSLFGRPPACDNRVSHVEHGMVVSRKFLCGRDLNGACMVHRTGRHYRLAKLFRRTGATNTAVMPGTLEITETPTRPGRWELFAQPGTYHMEMMVSDA